jgi:hypothetical protein
MSRTPIQDLANASCGCGCFFIAMGLVGMFLLALLGLAGG